MPQEIARRLINGRWTTDSEDDSGGGGGGSQTLAQVLAAGGDPDGNPITAPLEITSSSLADAALTISATVDNADLNLLVLNGTDGSDPFVAFQVQNAGGVTHRLYGGQPLEVYGASDASGSDSYTLLQASYDDFRINLSNDAGTTFRVCAQGITGKAVLLAAWNDPEEIIVGFGAGKVGFYGTPGVVQQTGVAVDAAGIHAALVNLGLITA